MSGVRNDFAEKLAPLNAECWQAWLMGERDSRPVHLDGPETVDEAVKQAMDGCCTNAGDKIAVLYTHTGRNKRTLWLFNVKRSTKVWDYRPSTNGGAPVRIGRPFPEMLLQAAVAGFAPLEAFDAFRDDPVGHDFTIVDAR